MVTWKEILNAALEFDRSSLEEVMRSEGYDKAKRERKGQSKMEARVGTGDLDIWLGLGYGDEE